MCVYFYKLQANFLDIDVVEACRAQVVLVAIDCSYLSY